MDPLEGLIPCKRVSVFLTEPEIDCMEKLAQIDQGFIGIASGPKGTSKTERASDFVATVLNRILNMAPEGLRSSPNVGIPEYDFNIKQYQESNSGVVLGLLNTLMETFEYDIEVMADHPEELSKVIDKVVRTNSLVPSVYCAEEMKWALSGTIFALLWLEYIGSEADESVVGQLTDGLRSFIYKSRGNNNG